MVNKIFHHKIIIYRAKFILSLSESALDLAHSATLGKHFIQGLELSYLISYTELINQLIISLLWSILLNEVLTLPTITINYYCNTPFHFIDHPGYGYSCV